MKTDIETERLTLTRLDLGHAEFIYELVNSPGWLQFIGNRNVANINEAENYIHRILSNPNISYWTVRLKSDSTAIGIVTIIKRDYLENYDIGFAFLPQYARKGYAYEASKNVLEMALEFYPTILATTISENKNSIDLLGKLGLQYEQTIDIDNDKLLIFTTSKK